MNIKQIREKKIEELYKQRTEVRRRYSDECLEMRMGKLKDVRKPNKTRKELARLEFVIAEKASPKASSPRVNKDKLSKKSKDGKAKA
ncbi:MAG: 50S ribosomal protein L29 [bacterium]